MKPHMFIASSSEGLPIAYALQTNLQNSADVTIWTQGVFRPSEFILESLLRQLHNEDIGVFVFSPDDVLLMRGEEHASVRDNVIFEFGLSVSLLGRKNSIIVAPVGEDLHLPSDLLGLNYLTFQPRRDDQNYEAALGPATNGIRKILGGLQPRASRILPELHMPFAERRDLLTAKQRHLLRAIEKNNETTIRDIKQHYPEVTQQELHYRLEQLRLLMFIAKKVPEGDPNLVTYSLTDAYRSSLHGRVQPYASLE